jgi:hypothetical protein
MPAAGAEHLCRSFRVGQQLRKRHWPLRRVRERNPRARQHLSPTEHGKHIVSSFALGNIRLQGALFSPHLDFVKLHPCVAFFLILVREFFTEFSFGEPIEKAAEKT